MTSVETKYEDFMAKYNNLSTESKKKFLERISKEYKVCNVIGTLQQLQKFREYLPKDKSNSGDIYEFTQKGVKYLITLIVPNGSYTSNGVTRTFLCRSFEEKLDCEIFLSARDEIVPLESMSERFFENFARFF